MLASCGASQANNGATVVPSSRLAPDVRIGTCVGDAGRVDLSNLTLLSGREVTISGEVRSRLLRQSVLIDVNDDDGPRTVVHNVGAMIDPAGGIDIQLSFARINDELAIFWRETFQNRSYRQGIMTSGDALVSLCEGRGGMDYSH